MKNIAIIPARSGSKGLLDKNIKKLCDKHLIAYSIEAAMESELFQEVMVSTDSEKYAEIACQYGAKVPFLRSEQTSSDVAGSWDVVHEVLENYRKEGICFDTVCLLQPTSPLRKSEHIRHAYDLLRKNDAFTVTSVCEVEHSPLWTMTLPLDFSMEDYRKRDQLDLPRQMLDKYYRVNGAIYIKSIQYKDDKVELLDGNEYAYIMPQLNSIDIDTQLDFCIAESIMKNYT